MILEFLRKLWKNKNGVYLTKEESDKVIASTSQTMVSFYAVMEILQKQSEFSSCQHELLETLFSEINSLNELTRLFYKWAELPEPINDGDRVKALQTWDQLQAAHRDALTTYTKIIQAQAELMALADRYKYTIQEEKINEN